MVLACRLNHDDLRYVDNTEFGRCSKNYPQTGVAAVRLRIDDHLRRRPGNDRPAKTI